MIPKFIEKIDWKLLRKQKEILNEDMLSHKRTRDIAFKKELWNLYEASKEREESLEGILHLIDAIQDYAVDELGISEDKVFKFEKE